MGYNQIVVALLLLATATPLAYGQLPGVPGLIPNLLGLINAANITGRICCTPTGNCANGSVGIPGVAVNLNCTTLTGSVVTLAQGITGIDGTFSLLVNNILRLLGLQLGGISGLLQCRVVASLPLNSTVCPILSTTTGILTSTITLVNVILNTLLGLVGNFVASLFTIITVTT